MQIRTRPITNDGKQIPLRKIRSKAKNASTQLFAAYIQIHLSFAQTLHLCHLLINTNTFQKYHLMHLNTFLLQKRLFYLFPSKYLLQIILRQIMTTVAELRHFKQSSKANTVKSNYEKERESSRSSTFTFQISSFSFFFYYYT